MSNLIHINKDYATWIGELKLRIRQSQIKAAVKVNTELLQLYWQLGSDIVEKQKNTKWGDGFLKQLSQDLSAEFPEMKGFSLRNIERIRKWYIAYKDVFPIATQLVPQLEDSSKTAQPVSQSQTKDVSQVATELIRQDFFSIPWGHHILIMQRCKDMNMALFYIQQTVENNLMRTSQDNPTIGLLICKDKNDVVAEYTLQGVDSPIGVSSVEIFNKLTEDFKSALPSIEDIENELRNQHQKEDKE